MLLFCWECTKTLQNIYKFRQKISEAQKLLNSNLSKYESLSSLTAIIKVNEYERTIKYEEPTTDVERKPEPDYQNETNNKIEINNIETETANDEHITYETVKEEVKYEDHIYDGHIDDIEKFDDEDVIEEYIDDIDKFDDEDVIEEYIDDIDKFDDEDVIEESIDDIDKFDDEDVIEEYTDDIEKFDEVVIEESVQAVVPINLNVVNDNTAVSQIGEVDVQVKKKRKKPVLKNKFRTIIMEIVKQSLLYDKVSEVYF
ncbi:uncharacterized protein LOC134802123 [Cydia splendana]|uniref:uncharacterized protein LOC134802123 n=1 Tax=Cydia splendana TaxID=1100963 RepID=UPI00300CDB03